MTNPKGVHTRNGKIHNDIKLSQKLCFVILLKRYSTKLFHAFSTFMHAIEESEYAVKIRLCNKKEAQIIQNKLFSSNMNGLHFLKLNILMIHDQ